jgi:hypothetical protein
MVQNQLLDWILNSKETLLFILKALRELINLAIQFLEMGT